MKQGRRKPGVKQQQILNVIAQQGGVYPPQWKLTYDQRRLLDHMVDIGLLVKALHSSGQLVYRLPTAS